MRSVCVVVDLPFLMIDPVRLLEVGEQVFVEDAHRAAVEALHEPFCIGLYAAM